MSKYTKEEKTKIIMEYLSGNEIIKRGLGKLDDIVINAKAFNPIASAGIKAVNDEIKNFTKTYAARLSQKYEWSIDKAFLNVQSGYMTPSQASKRAIEELFTINDLPDLVTKNGRHEQISTVVGRAIRTGTNHTMAKIQMENCKDLDCDLVEVSSHYGARPTHAQWQGQIYSLSGKSIKYPDFVKSTDFGGIDGLCGINCRHSFYPFFEGLSSKSFKEIDPEQNEIYAKLKDKERDLSNKVKRLTKKAKVLKAGGVDNARTVRDLKKVQVEKLKAKSDIALMNEFVGENFEYAKDFAKMQKFFGTCSDEEYAIMLSRNNRRNGYIETSNAFDINKALRLKNFNDLTDDDLKVIKILDSVIEKNTTPINLLSYRWDEYRWLENYITELKINPNAKNIIDILNDNIGHVSTNLGYTSASIVEGKNVFQNRQIKRVLKIPKGMNVFITRNEEESEIILPRGVKTVLESFELKNTKGRSYLEIVLKLIKE